MTTGADTFDAALARARLSPLWKAPPQAMPRAVQPRTGAYHWPWREVSSLVREAADTVQIGPGGDRRALLFANPGIDGAPFTSTTVHAAMQCLNPSERAPAHRHTPAAIRFVLSGSGGLTTVDGEQCAMEPGDLLLTPSWAWHEYHNPGAEPVVWFDGLDVPLVDRLECLLFEDLPEGRQATRPADEPDAPPLPAGHRELAAKPPTSSPLRYPRAAAEEALDVLRATRGDSAVSIEYVDPVTGGSPLPTIGCELHRLYPGRPEARTRRTGTSIYLAFSGRGCSRVGNQEFEWQFGDVFVVPSWSFVTHEVEEISELFAISDRPVLQALGLYREQTGPLE